MISLSSWTEREWDALLLNNSDSKIIISTRIFFTKLLNEYKNPEAITIAEDEFMIYDNLVVRGSDVVNFIYRNLSSHSNRTNAPIYVYVDTGSSKTQYEDNIWIDQTKDLSSIYYIHPLRKFKGKVVRNTNDVIIGVSFIAD